jgi:hypothetical protein
MIDGTSSERQAKPSNSARISSAAFRYAGVIVLALVAW